jgi:hypothetical protein
MTTMADNDPRDYPYIHRARLRQELLTTSEQQHLYRTSVAFRVAIDNLIDVYLPTQISGLVEFAKKAAKERESMRLYAEPRLPPLDLDILRDAGLTPRETGDGR